MSMKVSITAAALVAALAGPALAKSHGHHRAGDASRTAAIRYLQQSPARAAVDRVFDADARGPYNSPPGFAGYPTDYLMDRFGDRQMQGR